MIRHVVLGGGTAGYLTALLLKKRFPFLELSVVASETIGVVGPGEGLTPQINRFLQDLEIPIEQFLTETNGTFKNGINYVNWGTENENYLHSFYDPSNNEYQIFDSFEDYLNMSKLSAAQGKNLDPINLQSHLTYDNRVMTEYPGFYAFHIDANKLVLFLKKKAIDAGIQIIDEVVSDILTDDNNNISGLAFQSGNSIELDFIYDCSGFHRLIIDKHYKQKWISTRKHLPANSAIAGQLPYTDIPIPATTATALDYGWSWKIPLQNRYGCGYVFNDDYISFEDAEKELRKLVGNDYKLVWKFSFDSGFFENILVNNCLALGLSSSFFEPLEATAIDNVLNNLYRFLDIFAAKYFAGIDREILAQEFNEQFRIIQYTTLSFLYLHYMTNKTNSVFWTEFVNKYPMPDYPEFSLKTFLDGIKNDNLTSDMFSILSYKIQSWVSVYYGNELGKKEVVDNEELKRYNTIVEKLSNIKGDFDYHSKYLKNINK